jgi:hypothetical protein
VKKVGAVFIRPGVSQRDEFSNAIRSIQSYHIQFTRAAGHMVVASILAGMDLRHIQRKLKKSASGCTFKEWLAAHEDELGFCERTAFKYLAVAKGMRDLMDWANRGRIVVELFDRAPSSLDSGEMKSLVSALAQSINGRSLTEMYELLGIVTPTKPVLEDGDTSKIKDCRVQPKDGGDAANLKFEDETLTTESDGAPSPPTTKPKKAKTAEPDDNRFEALPPARPALLEPNSASDVAKKAIDLLTAIPEEDSERRAAFQLVDDFCHREYPNLNHWEVPRGKDFARNI